MDKEDSRKIVEILNNGFLLIGDALNDINKNLESIDESLQMILRYNQEGGRD